MKMKDKYDFTVEDDMFLSMMNVRKDSDRCFIIRICSAYLKIVVVHRALQPQAIPPLEADYGNITTPNPYSCVIHFLLTAVLLPLLLSMDSPPTSAI